MSETNKSYRIRTKVGDENTTERLEISEDLVQEYDVFEILSVDIKSRDMYRLHNSNHGIVVGRVLANNGFGIPNAKISIFIKSDGQDNVDISGIYPFSSSVDKDKDGVKYNLLPNERVSPCHQVVGTFPSKKYVLDNDVILEVFDKYYKYTAKTNNAGDYLICGVPTGSHTLHMDLDISDCGILSQRPRDFVYKGYTIEQFESPTKFKSGTDYENLSQIFTQDQVVNVNPLWGNESLGETIGLTRADIKVNFKFEPTCVFMGSIVSDNSSNGFTRKCIATDNMGMMEELVTGEGTIEMIRKTPGGDIEEFSIKGNKLINANGIWCYQIPMNLDYMATDEYGNMVPTDNPEKGIPTRASVRFRISMDDHEENKDNFHRGKVLVPHNPQILENGNCEDYDYNFGSYTRDDSFRDLYWNNVYSVKSYIPRIQKHRNPKRLNYSGIKRTNDFGGNNPMPYNNIRIRMPLMFMILCVLIKCYVLIVRIYNTVLTYIGYLLANLSVRIKWFKFTRNGYGWLEPWGWCFYLHCVMKSVHNKLCNLHLVVLKDGLCPDLENWFFAPTSISNNKYFSVDTDCNCSNILGSCCGSGDDIIQDYNILQQTLDFCVTEGDYDDPQSIDDQNEDPEDSGICLTRHTDYLISCIEMNLAQEYKVINFDFYNDWINGTIYNPRWTKYTSYKRKFFFWGAIEAKVKGCMDDTRIFSTARKYTQQCAIGYEPESYFNQAELYTRVSKPNNMDNANKFHKRRGMKQFKVFGSNGGVCHEQKTIKGQNVYYLKPCEFTNGRKVILFATDIILLGSFNDCDINGIPQAFKHLTGSTYIMPTNLALTNMDTNGPLYADNDMTICMQRQTSLSGDVLEKKIQEIQGSALTFATEIGFYSGNVNYTLVETDYPKGIELDTIPMTEAAGISWDYTGPGQADKDKYSMYYPGGHFLGLTCINSQTNIKSCINLSRICEIGTIMSQRKENVDGIELINDGKDGGHLTYNYIVPSGFISGDEIVDSDFRSMFATMNKKRLIATKINSKTGYKYYDFEFSNAINFDGTFSKLATPASKYNRRQDIEDEDLTVFGIKLGKDRDDYDPYESGKTITKTKEFVDLDYYLFRFGLTYKDLENGLKVRNKFLLSGEESYLPQYENSYYFYFGLTNGSTALDEFNKQFYSECDPITFRPEKNIKIIPELHFKEGYGYIDVVTQGLTLPIQRILIEKKYDRDYLQILKGDDFLHMFLSEQFRLKQLSGSTYTEKFKPGSYRVTIVDSDSEVRSEIVSLGDDLYNYSVTVFNFNQPVSKAHINYIDSATTSTVTGGADEVDSEYEGNLRGGSLRISDFSIRGYDYSDTSIFEYVRFRLEYDYNVGYTYTTNNSYSGGDEFVYGKYKKDAIIENHPDINNDNKEEPIDLPCSLNIVYKCKNGSGGTYDEVSVPVAEYYIDDNLYVALKGGSIGELNCDLVYRKVDTEEVEELFTDGIPWEWINTGLTYTNNSEDWLTIVKKQYIPISQEQTSIILENGPDLYRMNFELHATITGYTGNTLYMSTGKKNTNNTTNYILNGLLLQLYCAEVSNNAFANGMWAIISGYCGSEILCLTSDVDDNHIERTMVDVSDAPYNQSDVSFSFGYWQRTNGDDFVWYDSIKRTNTITLNVFYSLSITQFFFYMKSFEVSKNSNGEWSYSNNCNGQTFEKMNYNSNETIGKHRYYFYENLQNSGSELVLDAFYIEPSRIMSGMSKTWWIDRNHFNIGDSFHNTDKTLNAERWFYRALFYDRENNPENPFRVKVFAKNGKIALWGMAQNDKGIAGKGISGPKGTYFCNMSPNELLSDDYVLDEKAIYFPTYGITYTGSSAITDTEAFPDANGTKQYSMISYNDNDVCGYPKGLVQQTGTNGVSSMTINIYDSNYFHNGYGCVFKPVPDGKLIFITYDDKTVSGITYYNMKKQLSDRNWKYGLLYPTFIFPVIKRPFKLELKYTYWTKDNMEWPKEVEKWVFEHRLCGRNTYCEIENGITYNSSTKDLQSTFSKIEIEGINSATTEFIFTEERGGTDDIHLQLESSTSRKIKVNHNYIYSVTNGDETIFYNLHKDLPPKQLHCGYSIEEGYPKINGKSGQYLANKYNYSYELDLPNEIYYDLVVENGRPTQKIKSISPSESIDDETKLYLIYFSGGTNKTSKEGEIVESKYAYWNFFYTNNHTNLKFNSIYGYETYEVCDGHPCHDEYGTSPVDLRRLYLSDSNGDIVYVSRQSPSDSTSFSAIQFMQGTHKWHNSTNGSVGCTHYFYATVDLSVDNDIIQNLKDSSGNTIPIGLHGHELYVTMVAKIKGTSGSWYDNNNHKIYRPRIELTVSTEYINSDNEKVTLTGTVLTNIVRECWGGGKHGYSESASTSNGINYSTYYGAEVNYLTIIAVYPNLHRYFPLHAVVKKGLSGWPRYRDDWCWYASTSGVNSYNYTRYIDTLLENDINEVLFIQSAVPSLNLSYPYDGERIHEGIESQSIGALCVKTHVDENLNKTTVYKIYERLKPRNNSLAR